MANGHQHRQASLGRLDGEYKEVNMEYELYREFILHTVSETEVNVFMNKAAAEQGNFMFRSYGRVAAMFSVDSYINLGNQGEATQADVDELNATSVCTPIPKYPSWIMEKVRQRLGCELVTDTSKDAGINDMSKNEVFDACLEWEGIIGYGYMIKGWIKDIYGVTLE